MMRTLWLKENHGEQSMYVDPFAIIGMDYANNFKRWEDRLNEFKSLEAAQRSKKCNNTADELLQYGHTEFSNRNWIEALNYYSRALCFAECGTFYEGLAHGNRGLCFFQLGMYQKALIDFDFAARKKCPEQFMADIQGSRVKCQKIDKNSDQIKLSIPKMKMAADKKFPCLANALEIKGNKEFGRCIVAKKDIDIGQTVCVSEAFASAVLAEKQAYCYTCQKIEMNFIPCSCCSDVMFCDEDCANWNSIHKMDCRTCYHQINDIGVKFITQSILVAIEIFPNIESMIEMVETVTSDKGCDKIPKSSNDSISKYGIFLKLTPVFRDENLFQAYQAFTCILLIPKIRFLFDTESEQRFLMHLILHHATVIPKNAFLDLAQFSDQITVKYMFDTLSIINHSCAPNLHFTMIGKIGYCMSVRPIKKGDQVFINYLGEDVHKPTEQRQRLLKGNWNFDCQCDKCYESCDYVPSDAFKLDPSWKYIIRNYENSHIADNQKRITLKKQCVKFLKKYGHLPWSTELEFVINCFTSL